MQVATMAGKVEINSKTNLRGGSNAGGGALGSNTTSQSCALFDTASEILDVMNLDSLEDLNSQCDQTPWGVGDCADCFLEMGDLFMSFH